MRNNTSNTESQILASAEKLFIEKGFKGTSTTAIAKDAGCNQALVHYYFRTKENLFQKVFLGKFKQLFEQIKVPLERETDFFSKLENMVDVYFNFMIQNPKIPYFIFNELITNPRRRKQLRELFMQKPHQDDVYHQFCASVEKAISQGVIRDIEPLDLLMDVGSLVVFSFLMAPIITDFLDLDQSHLTDFVDHRKREALTLLFQGLRV
ncbi:MAG: TetR/AcrR family transcriptional regulator [Bacteroidota bacterium]|jgi:AcrR family transcriptional regulator|nr:TetR/AcrR family transcriptional regulator [Bacteroidota bacterium]HHU97380.1 TetR/AcrR family transcriptional regulator [Petrimonas sp.]